VSEPKTEANTPDGDALEDLIALYALDALDADDRARVERRLVADSAARRMLDQHLDTVAILGISEASVLPAARSKERIFTRIDAEAFSRGVSPKPASAWDRIKRALLAASPVLAISALVLAIGLGAWGVSLQQQLSRAQQEAALLQSRGLRVASLPRADTAPAAAQVSFISAPQSKTGLLTVNGLTPLASNETYQFWLLKGGQPVSAGLFVVDANGSGKMIVQSSEPIGAFEQAGITVEPAGGSATPTLTALVSIGNIQ
jgi:anti-sigma-K factor RskA